MDTKNSKAEADSGTSMKSKDISDPISHATAQAEGLCKD